jgi:hypothetical protein
MTLSCLLCAVLIVINVGVDIIMTLSCLLCVVLIVINVGVASKREIRIKR